MFSYNMLLETEAMLFASALETIDTSVYTNIHKASKKYASNGHI